MNQIISITEAIKYHEIRLDILRYLIENRFVEINPDIFSEENSYFFNKWLYNHIYIELNNLPIYNKIVKINSDFYTESRRIIQLAIDGYDTSNEFLPDSHLCYLFNLLKMELRELHNNI